MAASDKPKSKEINSIIDKANQATEAWREMNREELNTFNSIFSMRKKMHNAQIDYNTEVEKLNNIQDTYNAALNKGNGLHGNTVNSLNRQMSAQKKIIKNAERRLKIQNTLNESMKFFGKELTSSTGAVWSFLMDADKAIKNLNLELGVSGVRAEGMRDSFEQASFQSARLGVDISGLAEIQTTFADETGRAASLTSSMLEDVVAMGKGTGLGIKQAAQLAGQFELIGFNASESADYVEGVVDMTERMGVNTAKVLKTINKDFKKLQTYSFANSSKGFADMAAYSEKMKVNMDSVLSAAEKARKLDNVVDMAANLQVLGGEFAKMADPLTMLYESRNDLDAFNKRLNNMTKGMATMRKTSEGFEFELASPMARDMLTKAGEIIGKTTEEMTTQALRMREMQEMRKQMIGMGLSTKEKEIVEGMSKFDRNTGGFMVKIGSIEKSMTEITKQDLKSLEAQNKSLKSRAEEAQTFDAAFKNTVMELKSSLLPMLEGVNEVLKFVKPVAQGLGDVVKSMSQSGLGKTLLAGGGMLLAAGQLWGRLVGPMINMYAMSKASKMAGGAAGVTKAVSAAGGASNAATAAGSAGKMAGAGKGIGVGAAGLGIGAGVGLAAVGVSKLADSMSKLDKDQIKGLTIIATTLAVTFPLAAIGIAAVGGASTAAAPGLLALGGSILMIGAGIGVATMGIGKMAEGIGSLITSGKEAGPSLYSIAGGIGAIGASLGTMTLGAFGLPALAGTLGTIALTSGRIEKVGNAFGNIAAVLKGSKEDFNSIKEMVTSISNADLDGGGMFSEIANLLKNPLKVQFDSSSMNLTTHVNLKVDGRTLATTTANNTYAIKMGKG